MTMKDRDRKADQLRISGPKEEHDSKLPGLNFASYTPDLKLRTLVTKNSNHHSQKKKRKKKLQ